MSRIKKAVRALMLATTTSLLIGVLPLVSRADAVSSPVVVVDESGVLTITSRELGGTKRVQTARGKGMVLELPTAVRDVLVSDPSMVDAIVQTDKRIYLIAKHDGVEKEKHDTRGMTNIFLFDSKGERMLTIELTIAEVVMPAPELTFLLERLLPQSKIVVERIGGNVVLSGSVRNPTDAARASTIAKSFFGDGEETEGHSEDQGKTTNTSKKTKIQVINMLAVEAKEQVMLKVQVVEMNRQIIKQLGVDIGAAATVGNMTFSMLSTTPFSALGKDLIEGGTVYGNSMSNGAMLSSSTDKFSVTKVLKAMERNGMTRTLAEPNLTAISGETAKFHAGGEFPIPVSQDNDTITVEWKKFGVLLNFTPVVLSEGRISMQIKTEVSELSQEGAIEIGYLTLPGIATRNAETTVELPSGGSLMMAGLISDSTRQAINGLPGLKNLPVLGALFKSRDYVRQETELVVLVTPYVVNPVSARELQTPDVGFAPASDSKANLLGHLNRVYGRRERLPEGDEHGDYGFIVE